MPIVQQNLPLTFAGLDLITNALIEINAVAPGDPVQPSMASWALAKSNRLLDQWQAQRKFVYSITLGTPFTLVPSLNPHTIGPTAATFTLALRPVKIQNANIILNTSTPPTKRPLFIQQGPEGEKWYAAKTVPGIQTSIPTDLYYEPNWPNGSLWLYPVPNTAYQIELGTWSLLGSIALATTYTFPPGYQEALTLSLSEAMWTTFNKGEPIDPSLAARAAMARALIASNNLEPPHLATRDPGVPRSGRKTYFNYLTGDVVSH